ncbi:unnamed protein product [Phytophthora fragariaefolia]|uniref:Unnamed protein product n=1 Tax=Phytophthora fragariaefolia TaxID=1490495 RepID=A0A9W6U756_9STRA|nr:unnamed protein product [Phytophthora fragariaefolia]
MPAKDHQVISLVNAALSMLHGGCVLLMVGGSLWRRDLVFSPWRNSTFKLSKYKYHSRDTAAGLKNCAPNDSSLSHELLATPHAAQSFLSDADRDELLVFCVGAFATVQAKRGLQEIYVFNNEVCDCILNLVSCIGIPLIVILSYVGEYDSELTGFPSENWYNDEWSARVLNEFHMVVVVSWQDLASRTIFSAGVLFTAGDLKNLLRKSSGASRRRLDGRVACDTKESTAFNRTQDEPENISKPVSSVYEPQKDINRFRHTERSILHVIYGVFAVWGMVMIALRVQASMQPKQSQCVLQVRPWAESSPACYLAILDCYHLAISGKKDEVEAKWNEFDRSTVVTLVIRHCPALEIPDSVGDFHITTGIKVYNSTINEWGTSAALTNTNHPELVWIYLVRVNLIDGILPESTLSTDFPAKLYDLEFTYTNIRELPDDLDSRWLIGTTVYFEYSELTNVPSSLVQLEPYSVSLTGSPITELPAEMFEVADMVYMSMGSPEIQNLPHNVLNLSPQLAFIYMVDTNISFFWSWADRLVERSVPIIISGSPYCFELEKIKSGDAMSFSVAPSPEHSAILMNPSEANLNLIYQSINCDEQPATTVYPIDYEDSISALSVQYKYRSNIVRPSVEELSRPGVGAVCARLSTLSFK